MGKRADYSALKQALIDDGCSATIVNSLSDEIVCSCVVKYDFSTNFITV